MRVSINQPAYLPWLGYFDKIQRADVHVILDNVQFEKNSYINRNKVKCKEGEMWITVPVKTSGKFGNLEIRKLEISQGRNWQRKHWNAIECNYSKCRYFETYAEEYAELYRQEWTSFMPLTLSLLEKHLKHLDIATKIVRSSDLKATGKKSDLILNICKELDATEYISGKFGKDYLRTDDFAENKIEISYQNYIHPKYEQRWKGFMSNLAVIDLLFNEGTKSREIIRRGAEDLKEVAK